MSVSLDAVTFTSRFPLTRCVVRAAFNEVTGYAYILQCADGRRYYGSTNNLVQRLKRHRGGQVKSTAWRLPITLVYFEAFQTLDEARERERSFKSGRTRRKTIDLLIQRFPVDRLAPFH